MIWVTEFRLFGWYSLSLECAGCTTNEHWLNVEVSESEHDVWPDTRYLGFDEPVNKTNLIAKYNLTGYE